jgi:two-component system sensor histidine kinase RegB
MTAWFVGARVSRMAALLPADAAGHKNMLQLVQLRWLAVVGQLVTIAIVRVWLGAVVPLPPMLMVVAGLILLNFASMAILRFRQGVARAELFAALLLDVAALTAQLYLSGGATNPFVSLFLLQVVLASVLLGRWLSWVIVAATSICFAGLVFFHVPLGLAMGMMEDKPGLHILGMWLAFVMVAVLVVLFVTRISRNLGARDAYLADMRQRAAEEDHIVRLGLLASGAAHELGTPLSSLSVILNDWRREPRIRADPQWIEEIDEMQVAVARCKSILGGILMSAGETRGEAPRLTTVRTFLDELVTDWRANRPLAKLHYEDRFGRDLDIVSDTALKQTICNVLDNAADVSPAFIEMSAGRDNDRLLIIVRDKGPGFSADMLANLGKPYSSTKDKQGGGLGLFLVVNVMRKLGGDIAARNMARGGAQVTLTLPLDSLALPRRVAHAG